MRCWFGEISPKERLWRGKSVTFSVPKNTVNIEPIDCTRTSPEIPEAHAKTQNVALVVGRNPSPQHPCHYEVGDLVYFWPDSGNQIPIDGKVYRALDYANDQMVFGRFRGPRVKEALDRLHAQQVKSE